MLRDDAQMHMTSTGRINLFVRDRMYHKANILMRDDCVGNALAYWKLSPFRKKLISRVVTRLHSEPELQRLKPLGQSWCPNQAFRSWVDIVQCGPVLRSPTNPRTACPRCFRNGRAQTKSALEGGLSRFVCLRCSRLELSEDFIEAASLGLRIASTVVA